MLLREPAKDSLERVCPRVASAKTVVSPRFADLRNVRAREVGDWLFSRALDEFEGGVLGVWSGFVFFDEPRGVVGTDEIVDGRAVP
jgi:hypothetical protein